MSEVLYIKEVRRNKGPIKELRRLNKGLITTTSYDYDRENQSVIQRSKAEYTSADVYSYFLLNKESDEWVLRIYPIPNANTDPETANARMDAILQDMKEFGTTIAYVTKDSSFTAISIRDNGEPRTWDPESKGATPPLNHVNIGMSNKIAKRLSMLGTQTYLNLDATCVFVDEDDDTIYPHHKGMLYIKITDLSGEAAVIKDGQYFIRPQVRDEMVEKVYEEMLLQDPQKARRLRKEFKGTRTFNGRLVTSRGLVKGDAVVSDVIGVDVLVDRVNLKSEVTGNNHTALFQMFPQEQMGKVFTNRQTVSSFFKALMAVDTPNRENSEGLIKDALHDYIDDLITRFRSGEMMLHIDSLGREENDQIRNVFEKLEAWTSAGFSVNESLYLLMMEAGQIVDMLGCNPGSDDKKRRFPVPYATRVSIRNSDTYKMVHGCDSELTDGEGFVDPKLGLIVTDNTYLQMVPVLGGADLDDHVEIHYRTAIDDDEFFDITAGDTVMVIIRNPIGIESDGAFVASEFWVLRASEVEKAAIDERYGELPVLDMDELPICTAELDLPEASFVATEPELTPEYSKRFFLNGVVASSSAQGVYGTHANLMMAFRLYNIPFPFLAPEETFVDVCQQTRHPDDLDFISNLNDTHRKMLLKSGVTFDPWTKKRCGIKEGPSEDGLFTELVEYHKEQVRRFEIAARHHIRAIREEMKPEFEDMPVTRSVNGLPILLDRIKKTESWYRKQTGKSRLNHWDFEAIGNKVVDRLQQLELDSNSPQTSDMTTEDVMEAHAWLWVNAKPSHTTTSVRSMFYDTDQKLMAGALLDLLISVLR